MRSFYTYLFLLLTNVLVAQTIKTVKSSGTYYAGEAIQFEITGTPGQSVNYQYGYAATPNKADWQPILPAPVAQTVTLSNNTKVITVPPPPNPGQVTAVCRVTSSSAYAVAVYQPAMAGPQYPKPNDFEAFWKNQYQTAKAVPTQFTLSNAEIQGSHTRYTFTLKTISQNRTMAGYIFVPTASGTHPMAIRYFPAFQAAGGSLLGGTANNLIVVHCNLYDTTQPNQTSNFGESATNDPATFELRHIMLGSMKLLDYFESSAADPLIKYNQDGIGLYGNSRGGGSSILVSGLDHLLAQQGVGHEISTKVISTSAPAFVGNSNGSSRLTSFPHWTFYNQSTDAATAYYDGIHFANYYQGASFMEVNYLDATCPAETNLAALNNMRGKAILATNPIVGHSHKPAFWNYSFDEFFKRNLNLGINVNGNRLGYDVNAGADLAATAGQSIGMQATVLLENVNITGSLSEVRWQQVSGPGSNQATITSGGTPGSAQAQFPAPGEYILRFSGNRLISVDNSLSDNNPQDPNAFYTFIDYLTVTVDGTSTGNCTITAINATAICNDQGTPATGDDTYTIRVNPTATNAGTQYRVRVNGVDKGTYSFGSQTTLSGNYLISGGNASVTVEKLNQSSCSRTESLVAPAPCSTGTGCAGSSGIIVAGCGISVRLAGNEVKLESAPAGTTRIIKVRTQNWSNQYELCNDYSANPACVAGSQRNVPNGSYVVEVQGGNSPCQFSISLPAGSSGGTDADGDGVCASEDCNDNDPTVGAGQTPGTTCNDGNATTSNDVIQADGCACSGTTDPNPNCDSNNGGTETVGCEITVAVNGQAVSLVSAPAGNQFIVKVRTNNWSEQYELCNGYSNNPACVAGSTVSVTGNGIYTVSVQKPTGPCQFTISIPPGGGSTSGNTDADGDGVCSDVDCNDSDASVGAPQAVGATCNDGNPNTQDDVIQAGGCSCAGTPVTTTGGNQSGCGVTVSVSGQTVTFVSVSPASNQLIIKVRRSDWSEQHDLCNNYNSTTTCNGQRSVTVNNSGQYVVDIQGGGGSCSSFPITVGGSARQRPGEELSTLDVPVLAVFPNPTDGVVHIVAARDQEVNTLLLYDLNGRLLIRKRTKLTHIDLSKLPPGSYYLRVLSDLPPTHHTLIRR